MKVTHQQLQDLLDLIEYGLQFQRDFNDSTSDYSYRMASAETTAFIVSCWIVQKLGYAEGLGGVEVMEALRLDEFPSQQDMITTLQDFLISLGFKIVD